MVNSTVKNLIFDLGGVILDLHISRSHQEFARLTRHTTEEIQSRIASASCFIEHEKGLISDAEFRDEIRAMVQLDLKDEEIDNAWNLMLGDIPFDRLQLLRTLRKDFKVFLLSNTNAIHLPKFGATVKANSGGDTLDSFFDKAYYSHVIKMRKPDEEIFRYVLDQNQLKAHETLFLDDFPANLTGAEKTGIQTFHVKSPQSIFSLFA